MRTPGATVTQSAFADHGTAWKGFLTRPRSLPFSILSEHKKRVELKRCISQPCKAWAEKRAPGGSPGGTFMLLAWSLFSLHSFLLLGFPVWAVPGERGVT